MQHFEFHSARSIEEVAAFLAEKEGLEVIAGGAVLDFSTLRNEDLHPDLVLNLLEVEALRRIPGGCSHGLDWPLLDHLTGDGGIGGRREALSVAGSGGGISGRPADSEPRDNRGEHCRCVTPFGRCSACGACARSGTPDSLPSVGREEGCTWRGD